MRFGAVQRMAGGRQLRNAHFENESTFPLTTACLVANGVRERFAQKLGCARAVDLFEPVAVTCVLMDRLLTGAMVFAVDAPAGRFWLVFSPRSVVALVSAAFGERGARQPGALSGLENKALHTMVRELATLCAPLYGEANNLVLTHDYMPMYKAASYFEIRIALDLPVYIGILLDRDPSEQKSGSAVGAAQLAEVPFSVRSVAGSCAITLARLGALEIGDVLPMIRGETAHLITGSAVLAHGTCGIANGRNAFLVGTSGGKHHIMTSHESTKNIDLLLGVPIKVTVELGKTEMMVRDILKLSQGSVVELDRAAGSPVDLLVNERLVARGDIVSIDEHYGVRVSEIIGPVGPMSSVAQ